MDGKWVLIHCFMLPALPITAKLISMDATRDRAVVVWVVVFVVWVYLYPFRNTFPHVYSRLVLIEPIELRSTQLVAQPML